MAGELTVQMLLGLSKGLVSAQRQISLVADQAGTAMAHAIVQVGTAKESLALGDVATPGWCLIRNLDATNYVVLGTDADTPFLKLKAGEACLFRMAGTTLSCKANTAAVNVEYWVIED